METYFDGLWFARWVFQRGLAAIYLIAFVSALRQFRPLLGEQGLLPVPRFLQGRSFRETPTLFQWRYSDRLLLLVAWSGCALSALALLGLPERGPIWLSMLVWLVLYFLYLSIVNVGQVFYGFGWESMLCEAGFFAVFLGPAHTAPPAIVLLILRWMLFRVELGAGLIKLRHDRCWRDLTCLYYHYETQPLPSPLSRHFHFLPKWLHRQSVVFSHFVQLVAPFGLFLPQPGALIAGAVIVVHQLLLVISGNYAWLNWLTIVLASSALSDGAVSELSSFAVPDTQPRPLWFDVLLYGLLGATALLSIRPTLNFFSKQQLMNYSYNAWHVVNVYGAFGSVTKERYEIVVEGSDNLPLGAEQGRAGADWRAYEFKAKPGDPTRRPAQWAPYHLRLDWLMWFLPFGVVVDDDQVLTLRSERWFVRFVQKLLEGDAATLALLRHNPFPEQPPKLIRAQFYRYVFSDAAQKRATGAYWQRKLVGSYLRPTSRHELR
jgi:hypothetical protein